MYSLLYFELYKEDLQLTLNYISNILYNPDAANKLYLDIKQCCEEISKDPYIFSSYLGKTKLKSNYRKAKVGNYYLFFEINEDVKIVKIKRFIYSKMDSRYILDIAYK